MTSRIFVVGAPRSGTTLVQSILAAHPDLTGFTESHFFNRHYAPPLGGFGVLLRHPSERVREFLSENSLPAALEPSWRRLPGLHPHQTARALVELLDAAASHRGSVGWVEKTPRHLRFRALIEPIVPGGRWVHVVRRGAEVVRSLQRASPLWGRPSGLRRCIRRWTRDLARSAACMGRPRHVFLFFEDLVASPERTSAALLRALELPPEPAILARREHLTIRLHVEGESWKRDTGAPITAPEADPGMSEAEERFLATHLDGELYDRFRARAARWTVVPGSGAAGWSNG